MWATDSTGSPHSLYNRPMSISVAVRRAAFRRLHEGGCFVMPNPWDVGSARYLASLRFGALATSSAGAAYAAGLPDYGVERDSVLEHVGAIVAATDLPVNADFESGFAAEPEGVAENVRLCVAVGVAGLSIEDSTGDPARPLFPLDEALARLRAARSAIDATGGEVLLTARAECFLVGHDDALRESTRRMVAYAEAGADVLYAPGLRSREQIETVVRAVSPKPVNVLVSSPTGLGVADLAGLGVRRISVGSALARVAWGSFQRAAREIIERGTFENLGDAAQVRDLNAFFAPYKKC